MYIYFNNSFELFIWYVWSFDTFEVLETRSFCTKKKYTKYATKFAFLIMTDKLYAYHILPALKWKKILYVFYIVKCDVNCVFIVKNWLESQNKFAPIARLRFISFLCEFHLLKTTIYSMQLKYYNILWLQWIFFFNDCNGG